MSSASSTSFDVNEPAVRDFLAKHNWPYGLQDVVIEGIKKVPLRFFICDDSGSMNESDGQRLEFSHGKGTFVRSTRWAELIQALNFHLDLAYFSGSHTEFRMLNAAPPAMVSPEFPQNYEMLKGLFNGSPGGGTPLCRHIREVTELIRSYEPALRAHGQKACIIIATDGESSDGDIAAAMKPLEQLPVWVVVRLCTSDNKIAEYWNNIDGLIEVEMDVLDDFESEAKEIHEKNDWFTYAEPLHRIREFGIPVKAIDLLDERTLTGDQIRMVASVILGGRADTYPNPDVDWKAFLTDLDAKERNIPEVWDPVSKHLHPWFRKKEVAKALGHKGECNVM